MKHLEAIQKELERFYRVSTGLQVSDFVKVAEDLPEGGTLLVNQTDSRDLELALVFDRDIEAAFHNQADTQAHQHSTSVSIEEVSHFVYLSVKHQMDQDVRQVELELQSEVDRILLAFHGSVGISKDGRQQLWENLSSKPYDNDRYEDSRRAAVRFLRKLSNGRPEAWTAREFEVLREFFLADFSRKIRMSQ